jgi:hypothetical protein
MVRTRAVRFILILGLIALLLPVSLAYADGHTGSGTATISDAVIGGDPFAGDIPVTVRSGMLTLSMSGVAVPEEGTTLEAWLVSDDRQRKQSLGILEVSEEGAVNHEFVADPGENLFEAFNLVVVTVEPSPDADPGPSTEKAYEGALIQEVLGQVRGLHVPAEGTPAALGLVEQADLALASATQAQAAATGGDLEMAGTHISCAVGIIRGSADCGDGVGIIAYADSVIAAATAVKTAAEASDDPLDEPTAQASDATIAAANSVKESAEEAVADAALASAATSTQVATLHLGNVVNNLGSGGVTGSAETAYTSSQDMGTYPVTVPVVKLPPTGESIVPQMALYGLIGSLLLVLLGSVVFLSTRRRSGTTPA